MKRMKYVLLVVIVMSLLFGTMTVNAADTITINKEKVTVNVGDTVELSVEGARNMPTWTSYNRNIARVDRFGKVTAVRRGNTKIRARAGEYSKLSTITVVDSSIKLNKKDATIYHGGTSVNTVQLKATVGGASKNVTWKSSDEKVVAVDNNGKVTSVAEGTAVVTATANGKSASCPVTVKESSISLNMDNLLVSTKGTGSAIKVTPTIVGSSKSVKWATSDKTIATVSGGRVTGKKTGTAAITATANGVSVSCNVTVTEGLISISEEKVTLYAGGLKADTKQLKTNAAKTDVITWSSSNTSVATVSEKGLVTPVSAGTAVVSVECGGKVDTCLVEVKQTATNIAEDSIQLKTKGADKTYALNKQIVGKTASVKWTTSDNKVAAVSNGKVTAKKAGTATITATANGVSDSVTVNVADFDPTIKLNQQEYSLYTVKGNTVQLKATVDGASKTVTWASSDASVATVTNKGKVTAAGAGTATISASANGVTAECIVDVTESAVVLDSYSVSLDKGEKKAIGYDIIGTSQSVKWAAANSKIAAVSNGVITAKNYGETDIKVTANGVTSVCHVNVTNCKHQYDSGVVTVEPTCGTEGSKTFTCTLCGDSYKETIPATGKHKLAWETTVEADCVTEGLKEYRCRECGYTEKEEVIPVSGHSWNDWHTVVEPTDELVGVSIRNCTKCGLEEKKEIPVLDHVHDYTFDTKVVEADCTNDGCTIHFCRCGKSYTDDIVKAPGHDFGDWVVTMEPTSKEAGKKARTCKRCDYSETEEIPCTSHVHEYKDSHIVAPTCTEQGYTEHKCSCGDVYKDNYTEALGHGFGDWVITREPTDKVTGEKTRTCKGCGYFETEEIPCSSHVHEYKIPHVVAPTCTEQGYTEYECACGDIYKDDYTEALGHDFALTRKVEATCTDDGFSEYTCSRCGMVETRDVVNAEGHQFETVRQEPTCTEWGWEETRCAKCGYLSRRKSLRELGHTLGEWIVTKEPTCAEEGSRENRCAVCGDIARTETIPATRKHEFEWVVTTPPTCTEFGEEQEICKNCGAKGDTRHISSWHDWTDWEITKEPADRVHRTRDDFGTRVCHCTKCGKVVEESIVRIAIENGQSTEVCGIFLDDEAYSTLDMVNNLRATEKNLRPYNWKKEYDDLCCIRAAEISYLYSHERPSGAPRTYMEPPLYFIETLGENIAMGAKSGEEVFHSWETSEGHHANMVNEVCANYSCKGFVDDFTKGPYSSGYHWVQLFGGSRLKGDRYLPTIESDTEVSNDTVSDDVEEADSEEEESDADTSDNEVYTVSYAVDGMEDPNEYSLGDVATILEYAGNMPDGMEFIGWGTNDTDTTPSYQPGDQIEMTSSLSLVPLFADKETEKGTGEETTDSTENPETDGKKSSEDSYLEELAEESENSEESENVETTYGSEDNNSQT